MSAVVGSLCKEKAMPIYTYRCENCGVQFEREQSYSDEPLKICPECRKKSLKKVISPVGVIFKGSGFYSTDHKSPSGSAAAPASKKDEKKPEAKSESKETKPAEKTEAK
jgi:putative FmdB family regulatory protein